MVTWWVLHYPDLGFIGLLMIEMRQVFAGTQINRFNIQPLFNTFTESLSFSETISISTEGMSLGEWNANTFSLHKRLENRQQSNKRIFSHVFYYTPSSNFLLVLEFNFVFWPAIRLAFIHFYEFIQV